MASCFQWRINHPKTAHFQLLVTLPPPSSSPVHVHIYLSRFFQVFFVLIFVCGLAVSAVVSYAFTIVCHDVLKLQLSVFDFDCIWCIALVCLTGMIGGKILRLGITRPTRRGFRTCMPNCSRTCCGASRRTLRSLCRRRSNRYCELRCQTSRKSTTSEYYATLGFLTSVLALTGMKKALSFCIGTVKVTGRWTSLLHVSLQQCSQFCLELGRLGHRISATSELN